LEVLDRGNDDDMNCRFETASAKHVLRLKRPPQADMMHIDCNDEDA